MVVTLQLIAQLGQLVALGSVGSVLLLVATVTQYFVAPLTLVQLKVGVVETPVAPFDGADNDGGAKSTAKVDERAELPPDVWTKN